MNQVKDGLLQSWPLAIPMSLAVLGGVLAYKGIVSGTRLSWVAVLSAAILVIDVFEGYSIGFSGLGLLLFFLSGFLLVITFPLALGSSILQAFMNGTLLTRVTPFVLCLTSIGIVVVFLFSDRMVFSLHTDAKMEEFFQDHRIQYEELVQMVHADNLVIMNTAEEIQTRAKQHGLTAGRVREYLRLLSLARSSGVVRDPYDGVRFGYWDGMDSQKGYVHFERPPSEVVDSLDDIERSHERTKGQFKKLTDNWYIYYWNW